MWLTENEPLSCFTEQHWCHFQSFLLVPFRNEWLVKKRSRREEMEREGFRCDWSSPDYHWQWCYCLCLFLILSLFSRYGFWRESFSATSESAAPLESTAPLTHQSCFRWASSDSRATNLRSEQLKVVLQRISWTSFTEADVIDSGSNSHFLEKWPPLLTLDVTLIAMTLLFLGTLVGLHVLRE